MIGGKSAADRPDLMNKSTRGKVSWRFHTVLASTQENLVGLSEKIQILAFCKIWSAFPFIRKKLRDGQRAKVISLYDDAPQMIALTFLKMKKMRQRTCRAVCITSSPLPVVCFLGKGWESRKGWTGWQKLLHKNWSSHWRRALTTVHN